MNFQVNSQIIFSWNDNIKKIEMEICNPRTNLKNSVDPFEILIDLLQYWSTLLPITTTKEHKTNQNPRIFNKTNGDERIGKLI